MIKTKVAFLEGRLQKALIGWKKAGPPKKSLLFWSCKQAICILPARAQNYKSGLALHAGFELKFHACSK